MGTGFKGNAGHHHSISENLTNLKDRYPFKNGYFGSQGDGKKGYSRHISSLNPVETAKKFYNDVAYGGIQAEMPNGKGFITKMKDGTIISYREVSSSDGTSVVEINVRKSSDSGGIKEQKIHFVKE